MKRIVNCYSAQVKQLSVMVNILGTAFYNATLVYILINQIKFKLLLKLVKVGVFVLLDAVCVLHEGRFPTAETNLTMTHIYIHSTMIHIYIHSTGCI